MTRALLVLLLAVPAAAEDLVTFTDVEVKRLPAALAAAAAAAGRDERQGRRIPRPRRCGRALFFDTRLSGGGHLACASCHQPERSWTDGLPLAHGEQQGRRHTPSLWNVAYNRWYFWDGRADSLWSQALQPIRARARWRAAATPRCASSAATAAAPRVRGRVRSPAVRGHHARVRQPGQGAGGVRADARQPARAFDVFVAALRAGDLAGQAALDPCRPARGPGCSWGRGSCRVCHAGPTFTDGEFHDIGLGPAAAADAGRLGGHRPAASRASSARPAGGATRPTARARAARALPGAGAARARPVQDAHAAQRRRSPRPTCTTAAWRRCGTCSRTTRPCPAATRRARTRGRCWPARALTPGENRGPDRVPRVADGRVHRSGPAARRPGPPGPACYDPPVSTLAYTPALQRVLMRARRRSRCRTRCCWATLAGGRRARLRASSAPSTASRCGRPRLVLIALGLGVRRLVRVLGGGGGRVPRRRAQPGAGDPLGTRAARRGGRPARLVAVGAPARPSLPGRARGAHAGRRRAGHGAAPGAPWTAVLWLWGLPVR